MDTKLRELERQAANGDAEAEKRFLMETLRVGGYHPVLLQFYASRGLYTGPGEDSSVTCGRMFDGYDHSTRLKAPGIGETRNCGFPFPEIGTLVFPVRLYSARILFTLRRLMLSPLATGAIRLI